MTNTSTHPITVNGQRLDTWAYNISEKDGMVYVPGLGGSNIDIPGRHGALWVPKRHEQGRMVLSMWARHHDVNGAFSGSDRYTALRGNLDTLIRLFDSGFGLLDVRQQISPTDIRQAMCEVKAAIAPDLRPGDDYAQFKVELTLPDAFWASLTAVTWDSPLNAASLATHSLTTFAASTAPMDDYYFVVTGPITNPKIIEPKTGHYVQMVGTVPSGQQWVVNAATWSSRVGAGIAYTDNGTSVTASTVASGLLTPRLMGLLPGNPPQVRLEGASVGSTTRLSIRGRLKYK